MTCLSKNFSRGAAQITPLEESIFISFEVNGSGSMQNTGGQFILVT
jgi:hypothetical protein